MDGYECDKCSNKYICKACYIELRKDDKNLTKQKPKEDKLTKEEEEMFEKVDEMIVDYTKRNKYKNGYI